MKSKTVIKFSAPRRNEENLGGYRYELDIEPSFSPLITKWYAFVMWVRDL